jgi:hypothetical protein
MNQINISNFFLLHEFLSMYHIYSFMIYWNFFLFDPPSSTSREKYLCIVLIDTRLCG